MPLHGVIRTSLSSRRRTPRHPERSARWWTHPGWRRVYPWSPWAPSPARQRRGRSFVASQRKLRLKCLAVFKATLPCPLYPHRRPPTQTWPPWTAARARGASEFFHFKDREMFSHFPYHFIGFSARGKHKVPDEQQQQSQRQHVELKVPDDHHKQLATRRKQKNWLPFGFPSLEKVFFFLSLSLCGNIFFQCESFLLPTFIKDLGFEEHIEVWLGLVRLMLSNSLGLPLQKNGKWPKKKVTIPACVFVCVHAHVGFIPERRRGSSFWIPTRSSCWCTCRSLSGPWCTSSLG